jgi:3-oxoacyl-[acyl-carrier protein] reductase
VTKKEHLLIFGATGAIGHAVAALAVRRGWLVTAIGRRLPGNAIDGVHYHALDPFDGNFVPQMLNVGAQYSAACWAQGANANDSVYDVNLDKNRELYETNCIYILATLRALLQAQLLESGSRLCVISSIWQNLARQSKLSYCMTKAALQGLVLSAAADLAKDGHRINAVLPGAVDTPMTRQNLRVDQIDRIASSTGFRRLATLEDVTSIILYLCSPENTGITGQFIEADLGFSHVRIV